VAALLAKIYSPLIAVAVLSVGLLSLFSQMILKRSTLLLASVVAIVGAALAALAYFLDHSVLSCVLVALCVVALGAAWRYQRRLLSTTTSVSPAATAALEKAGITIADAGVAGWSSGMTARGAVILFTEVTPGPGDPETWRSLTKALTTGRAAAAALRGEGVDPTILVIPRGVSGIFKRTPSATIASLDRISNALGSLKSSIADPRALAEANGMVLSRATSRALGSKSIPGAKKTTTKVQHQGRVTKKS
jgi:membrane protein implicated in regulation of membrane protease activity